MAGSIQPVSGSRIRFTRPRDYILAADIGGTHTRIAEVNEYGHPYLSTKIPTDRTTPQATVALILSYVAKKRYSLHQPLPLAIGISFAGPVDDHGVIANAPNIWGQDVNNVPLAQMVQEATSLRTVAVNDMTAAAWREKMFGKAQGLDTFQIVTVSSGVGSKNFAYGRVLLGEKGVGGEIGHLVMDPKSRIKCNCGGFGHLESFASGNAAERIVKELARESLPGRPGSGRFWESMLYELSGRNLEKVDNLLLAQAVKEGDELALLTLDAVTMPLAIGLNHAWCLTRPQRIFIVGGFALAMGEPYFAALRSNLLKTGLFSVKELNEEFLQKLIVPGTDDDNSGLIGAAAAVIGLYQNQ